MRYEIVIKGMNNDTVIAKAETKEEAIIKVKRNQVYYNKVLFIKDTKTNQYERPTKVYCGKTEVQRKGLYIKMY